MSRNPQFWSSNGAQPEIRQEKRNHAHDFKFPENLKIWSHGGPRPIAHLLAPPRDSIAIPASLMRGELPINRPGGGYVIFIPTEDAMKGAGQMQPVESIA